MAMELTDLCVARRILRDIATCGEYPDAVRHLGLVPASPDVDNTEHRDAHYRKAAILSVTPEVMEYADRVGYVLAAIAGADSCVDDDDLNFFSTLAQRAAIGVVSHLVDRGYLEVAP